jgi:carbonic anhydrase
MYLEEFIKMMSKKTSILFTIFSLVLLAVLSVGIVTQAQKTMPGGTGAAPARTPVPGKRVDNLAVTQTKESQKAMTPARALQLLKDGNQRFVSGGMVNRDLRAQITATSGGQYPFATILSCQDSRTSSDLLFDLNKGDAFSLRIAGNVVNEDMLGGMEFGSKAAGAKLIAVIGHTKCGAIYGACDNVKLGNLTGLLDRIKPSITDVSMSITPRDSKNPKFVDAVAEANVRYQMRQIKDKSPILKEMIDKGEIGLVGGIYDISTGEVRFFEK